MLAQVRPDQGRRIRGGYQTNGMVERFNGRIEEVIRNTYFTSAAELEKTLKRYCHLYNQHIPQKNLGHLTPPEEVLATAHRIRTRAQLGHGVPIVLFCMKWVTEGQEIHLGGHVYATHPDNFNQLRAFLARLLRAG